MRIASLLIAAFGVICVGCAIQMFLSIPWSRPADYMTPVPPIAPPTAPTTGAALSRWNPRAETLAGNTRTIYVGGCPYEVRCLTDVACSLSIDVKRIFRDDDYTGPKYHECSVTPSWSVMDQIIAGKATDG